MADPTTPTGTQTNDERSRHLRALAVAGALATLGAFAGLAASTQGHDSGTDVRRAPSGGPVPTQDPGGRPVQDPLTQDSQDPFGGQVQDPSAQGLQDPVDQGSRDDGSNGGFFDPGAGGPSRSSLQPGGQMPSAPSMSGPS